MCQFNTIVLPANTSLEKLRPLFIRHQFTPLQVYNDSLQRQLPGKLFIISPKNQCDCGSVVASAKRQTAAGIQTGKEIEKLRAKGWSETKIKNHLASKSKANSTKNEDADIERANWDGLIKSILASTLVKSIGILAHDYSGNISMEVITIESNVKINLHEFLPQQLDGFRLDMYYEIQSLQ